ncbi:hypothetical protein CLAVI_001030 [Candidatus Clavichlamydia salmonicola]|uniref:hypothetical protein n=1 Tax=Candidatus Clavichlamydia salmonicola TaxID=469812 RepID=UPI001891BA3F|nr:hypothetical protein [Candidatus Clavichlamydia salmonicola]MBF5051386.1 hypothetical protein [Candidatus Clavichlamydia salmonicola]
MEILTSTINQKLLSPNLELFEKPLPIIIPCSEEITSLKRKSSFGEESSSHKQSRTSFSEKEPPESSLLNAASPQFSPNIDSDLDSLILNNLESESERLLEDTDEDFFAIFENNLEVNTPMSSSSNQEASLELLTRPTSQVLPIITLVENNPYFILENQNITNTSVYLDHVLNGVSHVLEHGLFFLDPSIKDLSTFSHAHLYHETLSTLLIFLLHLEPLLTSILNNDDKTNLGIEHQTLINKVMEQLQQENFSDYAIASIMEPQIYPNPPIASPSLKIVIIPTLEEAPPLTISSTNNDKVSSSQTVEKCNYTALSPAPSFIHLKINRAHHCVISMTDKNQRLPEFITQVKNLISKGTGYTCHSSIDYLGIKPFNTKADLLKTLYLLLSKNFKLHLNQKKIPLTTRESVKNTLSAITTAFYLESKEIINPNADIHSQKLLSHTSLQTLKMPTLTHYHIFLHFIRSISTTTIKLCTEKQTSSHPNILILLRKKEKRLLCTLKHLKILSTKKTVIMHKNNVLNIELKEDRVVSLQDLSLPLSSLLYENQVILREAFGKEHVKSKSYQRMIVALQEAIKITEAFAHPIHS